MSSHNFELVKDIPKLLLYYIIISYIILNFIRLKISQAKNMSITSVYVCVCVKFEKKNKIENYIILQSFIAFITSLHLNDAVQ